MANPRRASTVSYLASVRAKFDVWESLEITSVKEWGVLANDFTAETTTDGASATGHVEGAVAQIMAQIGPDGSGHTWGRIKTKNPSDFKALGFWFGRMRMHADYFTCCRS